LLRRAHDHRLVNVALLHFAARDRLLDRDDDDVAHGRGAALRTAQHFDALYPACAGIIGDIQVRLHLDHGRTLSSCLLAGRGVFRHHFPALALGNRTAFTDEDRVADLVHVARVVRRIALRTTDELLVDRVHDATLDRDDHGLVVLV